MIYTLTCDLKIKKKEEEVNKKIKSTLTGAQTMKETIVTKAVRILMSGVSDGLLICHVY